jgi:hypothetical protein
MPFKYDRDGSLDLYFQSEKPRRRQGSELAASAKRAVQPHDASLCAKERCADRKWNPPPVTKAAAPTMLPTQ